MPLNILGDKNKAMKRPVSADPPERAERVEGPAGAGGSAAGEVTHTGESWITTRFDKVETWGQRHSFWPFPFGTACCAIEFMSTVSSHYDMARFGSEVVRFSPRQSDLLIVAGTINDKMAPVLKKIYDQMAEPKWVVSMGACACSGGFYRAYHVMQGIDEIIPVDVYVPGCPPSPEGLMYGILQLKEKVVRDRKRYARESQARVVEESEESAA